MHVLVIPSWYPSRPDDYSGSFFREQALALNRHGIKVGVIYPHLTSLKNIFQAERLWGLVGEIDEEVPTVRSYGVNPFPRFHRWACANWTRHGVALYKKYVKDHGKPDVLHAHSALFGGALARKLSIAERVPYIVTEHSSSFARGLVKGTRAEIAAKVFADATRRIAVSSSFAQMLATQFDACGEWMTIPNTVNRRFLETPLRARPCETEFIFLAVSALTENKAVDVLIDAFANSFRADGMCRLHIIGEGPQLDHLKHLAQQRGVSPQVSFLGRLSRESVALQLARASVLVHSSKYETFGVILIEALAAGVPVVSTNCGGPQDIVTALDGHLVDVGDVESFACAMRDLKDNLDSFSPILLRDRCQSRFGEYAIARDLSHVYEAVVNCTQPHAFGLVQ